MLLLTHIYFLYTLLLLSFLLDLVRVYIEHAVGQKIVHFCESSSSTSNSCLV